MRGLTCKNRWDLSNDRREDTWTSRRRLTQESSLRYPWWTWGNCCSLLGRDLSFCPTVTFLRSSSSEIWAPEVQNLTRWTSKLTISTTQLSTTELLLSWAPSRNWHSKLESSQTRRPILMPKCFRHLSLTTTTSPWLSLISHFLDKLKTRFQQFNFHSTTPKMLIFKKHLRSKREIRKRSRESCSICCWRKTIKWTLTWIFLDLKT